MSRIEQMSKIQRDIENGAPHPTGGASGSNDLLCCADCSCEVEFQPCEACDNNKHREARRVDSDLIGIVRLRPLMEARNAETI